MPCTRAEQRHGQHTCAWVVCSSDATRESSASVAAAAAAASPRAIEASAAAAADASAAVVSANIDSLVWPQSESGVFYFFFFV